MICVSKCPVDILPSILFLSQSSYLQHQFWLCWHLRFLHRTHLHLLHPPTGGSVLQANYLTALHRVNTLVAYLPIFRGNHAAAAQSLLDCRMESSRAASYRHLRAEQDNEDKLLASQETQEPFLLQSSASWNLGHSDHPKPTTLSHTDSQKVTYPTVYNNNKQNGSRPRKSNTYGYCYLSNEH